MRITQEVSEISWMRLEHYATPRPCLNGCILHPNLSSFFYVWRTWKQDQKVIDSPLATTIKIISRTPANWIGSVGLMWWVLCGVVWFSGPLSIKVTLAAKPRTLFPLWCS